jgi:opacity protein-like surface antigen
MICVTRDNGAAARRRRRRLRAGVAMLAAILLAPAAVAADLSDYSILRGSYSDRFSASRYSRWDGVNFGVQLGLTSMDTDFGNSTSQLVAYILRNSTLESEASPSSWTALPHNITNSRNYGAFLGYSTQWEQLVLGIDAAYNRPSSMQASASDSISRRVTTSDGVTHDVTITAQSTMKLVDYATLRMRAGYAVGQFLPYAFVGGAVGRFNYTSSATVTSDETPPAPTPPFTFGPITQSNNKDNAVVGGFTVGLGMDVAVLPNVFLRGEWEFVGFAPANGIRSAINTGRVALGVKF